MYSYNNVYFIESLEQHPLLDLLGLNPTSEFIAIENQESSIDDWQKEARRLELQGKQAQANAIRSSLLQTQKVPWAIVTPDFLIQLREKALNIEKKDKDARLLLFEYAMHYQQYILFDELSEVGFAPALKPKKDYSLLERKYFMGYSSSNTAAIIRQIDLYGVDFRTLFNQTPLMLACSFGNNSLVNQLIEKGANLYLIDNLGRNAFQIALQKALFDKRFAKDKFSSLYVSLSPDNIRLQVDDKLIKIDSQRMEFFLVNAMIAMAHQKQNKYRRCIAFTVDDFLEPLTHFPDSVMLERRKRRPYILSLLAKNEINRQDLYNKKLFLRIRRGHYILNPHIQMKSEREWTNIYKLLSLDPIQQPDLVMA